jgi:cytochrome c55X
MRLLSSLAALAATAALGVALAATPATPGRERERRLTEFVRQDCGSCHGLTLKGGIGRALLPENLAHFDSATLAAVILDGVPGTPMPPWRGLLSDEDARWIAERLKEGFPP